MADYPGYVMSVKQLNSLWHYENFLANVLLDMPLRKCDASPCDLPGFEPMNMTDYTMLKSQIRSMWVKASFLFTCKKGDYGWGLFANEDFEKNKGLFTETKPLVMGWLVRVPSSAQCPTGHRYLRSPCSSETYPMYLGGPISMCNYDPVNRVLFKRNLSNFEPQRYKIGMYKAKSRKIVPGTEIVWTYNLDTKEPLDKSRFYPQEEWQLVTCCSEIEGTSDVDVTVSVSPAPDSDSEPSHSQPSKKRKVGGRRPCVSAGQIPKYRLCPYCGVNLYLELKPGQKCNYKNHLALKHAAHLCLEMDVEVNNEERPVCAKDFIKHLDKVDHIHNALKAHNYKVVPACSFLPSKDIAMLPLGASAEDKEALFETFLAEAHTLFRNYQIVFLKGISVPQKYEDLIKIDANSNYSTVNWQESPPSGSLFSLTRYKLSEEESSAHELDIKTALMDIVLAFE